MRKRKLNPKNSLNVNVNTSELTAGKRDSSQLLPNIDPKNCSSSYSNIINLHLVKSRRSMILQTGSDVDLRETKIESTAENKPVNDEGSFIFGLYNMIKNIPFATDTSNVNNEVGGRYSVGTSGGGGGKFLNKYLRPKSFESDSSRSSVSNHASTIIQLSDSYSMNSDSFNSKYPRITSTAHKSPLFKEVPTSDANDSFKKNSKNGHFQVLNKNNKSLELPKNSKSISSYIDSHEQDEMLPEPVQSRSPKRIIVFSPKNNHKPLNNLKSPINSSSSNNSSSSSNNIADNYPKGKLVLKKIKRSESPRTNISLTITSSNYSKRFKGTSLYEEKSEDGTQLKNTCNFSENEELTGNCDKSTTYLPINPNAFKPNNSALIKNHETPSDLPNPPGSAQPQSTRPDSCQLDKTNEAYKPQTPQNNFIRRKCKEVGLNSSEGPLQNESIIKIDNFKFPDNQLSNTTNLQTAKFDVIESVPHDPSTFVNLNSALIKTINDPAFYNTFPKTKASSKPSIIKISNKGAKYNPKLELDYIELSKISKTKSNSILESPNLLKDLLESQKSAIREYHLILQKWTERMKLIFPTISSIRSLQKKQNGQESNSISEASSKIVSESINNNQEFHKDEQLSQVESILYNESMFIFGLENSITDFKQDHLFFGEYTNQRIDFEDSVSNQKAPLDRISAMQTSMDLLVSTLSIVKLEIYSPKSSNLSKHAINIVDKNAKVEIVESDLASHEMNFTRSSFAHSYATTKSGYDHYGSEQDIYELYEFEKKTRLSQSETIKMLHQRINELETKQAQFEQDPRTEYISNLESQIEKLKLSVVHTIEEKDTDISLLELSHNAKIHTLNTNISKLKERISILEHELFLQSQRDTFTISEVNISSPKSIDIPFNKVDHTEKAPSVQSHFKSDPSV
ncbi:hypothetical protein AYI68_g7703, partial [Smittium mucronatum]